MRILTSQGIHAFAVLVLLCTQGTLHAQDGIVLSGRVQEAQSRKPIPYATVLIATPDSGHMVAGTTTDEFGRFEVRSPIIKVHVRTSFIGFRTDTLTQFKVVNGRVDLGEILLEPSEHQLDEVVVVGERSRTHFELDKRVFTVGKDLSSTGASALEVLNNVPSVAVSVEGTVSLRGSSGVQILINGKPSVLTDGQNNALGTITADMIESVEVITNPSAKYDAAGTSGILNIVLKKEQEKGLNGSASVNTGTPHNHSVGMSMNRRTQRFNLFTQLGAGHRSLPRYAKSINVDRIGQSTVASDGVSYRNETFFNVTLGTDYYIDPRNVITLSGNFAHEWEENPSHTDFSQQDADGATSAIWRREETTEATNPKWQYDLQYKRQFTDHEDHTLLLSAQGSYFGKDLSSAFTNSTSFGPILFGDQQVDTKFERADNTLKLDYVDPITEKFSIETGAQYALNDVGNDYMVRNLEDGVWVTDPDLTNDFTYEQKVTALYGTVAHEGKRSGVKLGMRMEHTDLTTELVTTGERNRREFIDLFPSGHASHKITETFSVQAGYSRRIYRPQLWDLNPFFNITNNFNIRTGNPDLQPEYTDSYEFTSILIIPKASLNGSIFHRYTSEVIERISTLDGNVSTTMPMNIGTNNATGLEFNCKYDPVGWLTLSGDLNYNRFERIGAYEERSFDFAGQQWSARLTTKLKLPKDLDVEFTGNQQSGYRTIQSEVSGYAFLDMGLRKKFNKGRAILNFSIRDVFASRISESVIDQPEFYLYSFDQRGRFITIGFSYGLGKGEAMTYSGRRR